MCLIETAKWRICCSYEPKAHSIQFYKNAQNIIKSTKFQGNIGKNVKTMVRSSSGRAR